MRILEVGCNIGNQLLCLQRMGFENLYGIEPQDYAVEVAKKRAKGIQIIKGNIFDIPFKDGYFDLVFTSGVLIHISPRNIKKAIKEIYRCSRKYIWCFEYFIKNGYKEVNYRGESDLLWKTDFKKVFLNYLPDLKLVKENLYSYIKDRNLVDQMFLVEKRRR